MTENSWHLMVCVGCWLWRAPEYMRSLFAQRTTQEVFRCYLRLKEKGGEGRQDTIPDRPQVRDMQLTA